MVSLVLILLRPLNRSYQLPGLSGVLYCILSIACSICLNLNLQRFEEVKLLVVTEAALLFLFSFFQQQLEFLEKFLNSSDWLAASSNLFSIILLSGVLYLSLLKSFNPSELPSLIFLLRFEASLDLKFPLFTNLLFLR